MEATTDQCHKLLHLLGWSTGESTWRYAVGSGYWQVDATDRNGEVIIARDATQTKAWALAVRMAGESAGKREM